MPIKGGFKKLNIQGGPVRALHREDDVIRTNYNNTEEQYELESNQSMTPNIVKGKKPPLMSKGSNSVSKIQSRAQSVDTSVNVPTPISPSPYPGIGEVVDLYQIIDEPLINPEK